MKNVHSLITASLTFLLTNLIQTASGLAETAQIFITGNGSSTTNTTLDGGPVSDPVHWGVAGLFMGVSLLEISALNYSRKIWQSENIEQATKNYIHSTIHTVAMAGCCTTALRLGNVINPSQTAALGLGILHPNFLLADLLLFFRVSKANSEASLERAQRRPVSDVRVGGVYTLIPVLKIGMLLSSGIIQATRSSVEYDYDQGDISVNRAQLSTIFILLRIAIDFPTKQVYLADIKDVVSSYFCCFLPCRQQPRAGAQQIQQDQLNQPLIPNV